MSTKGLSFKHVDVEGTKFIILDSEGSYAPVKVVRVRVRVSRNPNPNPNPNPKRSPSPDPNPNPDQVENELSVVEKEMSEHFIQAPNPSP